MIASSRFILTLLLLSGAPVAIAFTAFKRDGTCTCTTGRDFSLNAGKGFGRTARTTTKKPKLYPPLTREEIETWMSHIPIYAVTDSEGKGQVLSLDNKLVFYFFLSPAMAEAQLEQLGREDLTVSGLFLGKVWFDLLAAPMSDDVEYRLVPDARDLLAARSLLTIDIDDDDSTLTKAMTESPRFNALSNEIPLFCINNMPPTGQNEHVKKMLNDMVSSNYMFFSSQNMLHSMKQIQGDEVSENKLQSLHEVVSNMMSEESPVDFRNVVLVPPSPIEDGPVSEAVFREQLADPNSLIGAEFFQPLLKAPS